MSEAIIVAVITGGLSLIGVIVSNNRTAQSMDKSMDAKLDKQQAHDTQKFMAEVKMKQFMPPTGNYGLE